MSMRILAGTVLGVLLTMAGMAPAVRADQMSELTKVTFQQPVRIPGRVLLAGTYYFTRLDNGTDPNVNVIQIYNRDRKSLNVILLTMTVERENARARTVLTFAEVRKGRPPALVDWFYPGKLEGHEFLYSTGREERIERAEKIIVASNGRGETVIQHL
jgi:hypothetical protein